MNSTDAERSARPKVLVVDDDGGVRRAVADLLKKRDYEVATFPDGYAALQAVTQGGVSLIVSDIRMPQMDGVELLRATREIDLDLPVILLTGAPSLDTAREAEELGAFRYLTKPFDREQLDLLASKAVLSYRLAVLKRRALHAQGRDPERPGDKVGLQVRFARVLAGLWMDFQPIVRAEDGSVFGYEAFLRTTEASLSTPVAVLDAATKLGRMCELGRATRARAALQMRDAPPGLTLFVNLHPTDLLDDQLLSGRAPLTGLAPGTVLEVTERATLADARAVRERIKSLREVGYRLAVDDLGAGHAGLATFAALEPEFVKIDMSLTRDIDSSPLKRQLVRSLTAVCTEVGAQVVAEGIETAAERDQVVELGCHLVQGYFVAKPGPGFPKAHW